MEAVFWGGDCILYSSTLLEKGVFFLLGLQYGFDAAPSETAIESRIKCTLYTNTPVTT